MQLAFLCARCARSPALARSSPNSLTFTSLARSRPAHRLYSNASPAVRPFRMAVIGSGPAGFYTAYRVLNKLPEAHVDMYEQLPVPYGLVRFGVAPDHPEVKNCIEKFEEVAASPRFTFIGNVDVGHQLPLSTLTANYDAIVFAYGASRDRKLNIPGEDELEGVYSARAFVGWYNGLPEYRHLNPRLDAGDQAVIIGNGNVALDVARVLLSDVDVLRRTDMTEYALEALSKSKVKSVRVVGRRGPMQASFTIKELRELLTLPHVAFTPVPTNLMPTDPKSLPRAQRRIAEILAKGSPTPASSATKSWSLDFFLSPTRFNPSPISPSTLSSITFTRTQYAPGANPLDPSARVVPSPDPTNTVDIPTPLAFRSVGYLSLPLPGMSDLGIPFDRTRGVIPNDLAGGRVLRPIGEGTDTTSRLATGQTPSSAEAEGAGAGKEGRPHGMALTALTLPGLYAAGWVKRGPTGVIASTMADAFATADAIASDWVGGVKFLRERSGDGGEAPAGWEAVRREVEGRGLRPVAWEEWRRIDAVEKERGASRGKVREKMGVVGEMLGALG